MSADTKEVATHGLKRGQIDVIRCLAQDLPIKRIAREFGIVPEAVRSRLKASCRALGVEGQVPAIAKAIDLGVVTLEELKRAYENKLTAAQALTQEEEAVLSLFLEHPDYTYNDASASLGLRNRDAIKNLLNNIYEKLGVGSLTGAYVMARLTSDRGSTVLPEPTEPVPEETTDSRATYSDITDGDKEDLETAIIESGEVGIIFSPVQDAEQRKRSAYLLRAASKPDLFRALLKEELKSDRLAEIILFDLHTHVPVLQLVHLLISPQTSFEWCDENDNRWLVKPINLRPKDTK